MNRIALVTANFGGIDRAWPIPTNDSIDAFYYTEPSMARAWRDPIPGWKSIIVTDYPRADLHPRLRAKYFKLQMHRLDEVQGHDWIVWSDASLQFNSLDFLVDWSKKLGSLRDRGRALFVPHPERATVLEEYAYICEQMKAGHKYLIERYGDENMSGQMAFLNGVSDLNAKLWCGGLWMVENGPIFHSFLNDWWDQNLRYSIMDQLPMAYLFKKHGIDPQVLDVNIYANQYFQRIR